MLLPAAHQAKIQNERQIEEAEIGELLANLAACANVADAKAFFDAFCLKHRLRGHPVALGVDEKLGRLAYEPAFARRLARSLASRGFFVEESELRALLGQLFDSGSPYEEQELLFLLTDMAGDLPVTAAGSRDFKDAHLATLVWIFRNPARCTTCSRTGLTSSVLPFRLGLQAREGDRYLGFDIDASHLNTARLPTVLDACWDQLPEFEPGGRTRPTGGLPIVMALEEVVAIPPPLRAIHGSPVGIVAELVKT
jgi:hypothetical protein